MTLARPIKNALHAPSQDDAVMRGFDRVQRKRRTRKTVRRAVLASVALVAAAVTGYSVKLGRGESLPRSAALDSVVGRLPKVVARGRAQPVARPMEPQPEVPAEPTPPPTVKGADVDVVAALLESVLDAYRAGNLERAAALLSEVAAKHPEDPRAAEALYLLGRIQLERFNDRAAAAVSFNHALELKPPPELVPELWDALQSARE